MSQMPNGNRLRRNGAHSSSQNGFIRIDKKATSMSPLNVAQ